MRHTTGALVVAGAVALAGAAALVRTPAHATTPPAPSLSIDHVRYRFALAESPIELASIADLEARVAAPTATPFDTAELANLYLRRGDLDRAEALARRSLAALPSPNAAPLTLARIAAARHDFRGAIAITREYLATAHSASAYQILTTAHLALGELPAAAESADTEVADKPSSSAYLMRALVFAASGRDAEAGYDFARAVVVEDAGDRREATRLRSLWARFLIRRGDTASASLVIDEALRISPDDPLALAQRAELALRTGHAPAARDDFERAFIASHQLRYLIDEARALELAGVPTNSTRAQVEKLLRADLATSTGHTLELVELLVDRGSPADLREALSLAAAELARRPSADVRFQLARAYHRLARPREGLAQIRAALASGIHDARIYDLASRLDAAIGNAPRAQMYAHEASVLDPANSGWRSLGMAVTR